MHARPHLPAAVVSAEDAPAFWRVGILWNISLSAATTAGEFTRLDQTMARGAGAPPHVHERYDEGFFIIEGAVEYTVGEGDDEQTILAEDGAAPRVRGPVRDGARPELLHPGRLRREHLHARRRQDASSRRKRQERSAGLPHRSGEGGGLPRPDLRTALTVDALTSRRVPWAPTHGCGVSLSGPVGCR